MANTKNTKKKSGKSNSSGKNTRKKKNSSDDTMKFLLVLVIAGIAIAMILLSRPDTDTNGDKVTGIPTPTIEVGQNVVPENTETPVPTSKPDSDLLVNTPTPTKEPVATETPVPENTPTPTPTIAPTPVVSASEAEQIVTEKVDASKYDIQLVNEDLKVGNGNYYQFGAIKNQEFVYPFFVVNKADASLSFYDSTEGTVFDFTKFPLVVEATPTPTVTPVPVKNLTAEEAYQVLCTYSKDALHIAKEAKEYDAEYGDELTLINGVDCYRFNLSEFSNGKVRNRGEFYISVDGTKCFYIDSNTNEFIQAVK